MKTDQGIALLFDRDGLPLEGVPVQLKFGTLRQYLHRGIRYKREAVRGNVVYFSELPRV